MEEQQQPKIHRCRVCHRGYKRPEHLKRHMASHLEARKHTCNACGRAFSRSDALKRHLRTCPGQASGQLKSPRRRACDRCVRTKKGCDSQLPCRTCTEKNVHCSYTFADSDEAPPQADGTAPADSPEYTSQSQRDAISTQFLDDLMWTELNADLRDLADTSWTEFLGLLPTSPGQMDDTERTALPFLDNFTKSTGMIRSFDCATLSLRQMAYENAQIEGNFTTLSFLPSDMDITHIVDPLSEQCDNIVALIQEVATIKPRNSSVDVVWSEDTHQLCAQFFAPANVRKYIELYWSIWHPNINFLHRPTFDPMSTKPGLVAVMAIVGATLSPNASENLGARVWFNAVEEMVFIDDEMCGDVPFVPDHFPAMSKIQALQAAYLMCILQNWEGTDASKRRTRRQRYSALVSAARDIGIHNAVHLSYNSLQHFDWSVFAAREQLIRTILWIFLLDTAWVIFNNLPPRMVMKEMRMHLATCEGVFQAESREMCFYLLQQRAREKPQLYAWSLCQVAEILCDDEIDESTMQKLADLGPLNMFVLSSGLHCRLFQCQNSFYSASQLGFLRNANENWRRIWLIYMRDRPGSFDHAPIGAESLTAENMWQRIGFMRYASEYWLLASLLLDRICVGERYWSNRSLEPAGPNSGSTDGLERTIHPVLQRYDQTSMQQVNDLIADFQRTSIS